MAARGPYAKGVAKRREILEAALEIVDEHGYSNATVKELADAVGLSPNGLLHYFGSKTALFLEIVRHGDQRSSAEATAGSAGDLRTAMVEMFRGIDRVAGMDQLVARLMAEATEEGHPAHDYFTERDRLRRGMVESSLDHLRQAGRIRADADPALLASMVFALVDGLSTQRRFSPDLDIPAHMEQFFDLLGPCGQPDAAPAGPDPAP